MNRRTLLKSTSAAVMATPFTSSTLHGCEPPKAKIKIGQIGTTHAHAGGKLATIQKFADDYELVGVVEPDENRREQLKKDKTYKDVKWMSEKELLGTKGLQAVAVETHVRDLLSVATRAVDSGVHIHLDKPAGTSFSTFKALLDSAHRQSLVVQMGYMYRYNPAFVFLFEAVRAGWLGELFEVHAVMSKTVGAASRKQLAEFKGGSMFELGCHLIDAVVAVLGTPDKVTAYNRKTREDSLFDNCLAVFEYPKATATVRSALMEVDGFRRRQFVVCGDRGTIAIRPMEPPVLELTLDRPQGKFKKGSQKVSLEKLGGRYDGDFADLAKIIRGEKKPDFQPSHDLAVQRAVLQASGMLV